MFLKKGFFYGFWLLLTIFLAYWFSYPLDAFSRHNFFGGQDTIPGLWGETKALEVDAGWDWYVAIIDELQIGMNYLKCAGVDNYNVVSDCPTDLEFADIDAWTICLETKDIDEIIRIVKAIAPGFGGINLEDIAAPRCFEIEQRLRDELDIPVFHDDQHGTAVVTAAALIQ